MSEFAALVAIDWADQQHAVCLLDTNIGEREQAIVKHTPAAFRSGPSVYANASLAGPSPFVSNSHEGH